MAVGGGRFYLRPAYDSLSAFQRRGQSRRSVVRDAQSLRGRWPRGNRTSGRCAGIPRQVKSKNKKHKNKTPGNRANAQKRSDPDTELYFYSEQFLILPFYFLLLPLFLPRARQADDFGVFLVVLLGFGGAIGGAEAIVLPLVMEYFLVPGTQGKPR